MQGNNAIGSGKFSRSWAVGLSLLLLILSGAAYRVLAARLELVAQNPIELPVPLSRFPIQTGGWSGKDVPIPPNIQRVAGNDAFLNRLYIDESGNRWANLYIAYSAKPRNMLGHRPQVCYVGGGWVHDGTDRAEVLSVFGRRIPCLIHRFHTPAPDRKEVVVLNFYIANGQLTNDESSFSGVSWRTPNIAGDAARYVAQVQISSVTESAVRSVAREMTELIVDFFPDKNGIVRAEKRSSR